MQELRERTTSCEELVNVFIHKQRTHQLSITSLSKILSFFVTFQLEKKFLKNKQTGKKECEKIKTFWARLLNQTIKHVFDSWKVKDNSENIPLSSNRSNRIRYLPLRSQLIICRIRVECQVLSDFWENWQRALLVHQTPIIEIWVAEL